MSPTARFRGWVNEVGPAVGQTTSEVLMNAMEALVRRYSTQSVNGQRLRLYTTRMAHPENARVGLLGFNQATGFPADKVSPDQYVAAMLDGRRGRALYEELRGERGPSRTRQNIDRLSERLGGDVLEFNVVCYATSMGGDLTDTKNPGGKASGRQACLDVLTAARLPVLIVHGSRAAKELGHMLSASLPPPASKLIDGVSCRHVQTQLRGQPYAPLVFVIPSLAPPAWNRWQNWAEPHIAEVAAAVANSSTPA
jgi:hypothetical protein